NQIVVVLDVTHFDTTVQRADDPASGRHRIVDGVADGDDVFTVHQVTAGSDGNRGQGIRRFDFQYGQVGLAVVGHELGDGGAAVGQCHVDSADSFHHMIVGDNITGGIDDHAGSHAVDFARRFGRVAGVRDD